MSKVIVIGSVNIDYTIYVENFPIVGETLLGDKKIAALGGKGVNQAIAIKNAGADVSFICFVGIDECATQIKSHIAHYGLKTYFNEVNMDSGNAYIFVDKNSNNEIVVLSGANFYNDISLIKKYDSEIKEAEYIVLQNEIHKDMNEYIIKTYGKDHKIVLNPAPGKPIKKELIPYLYCITPNEGELALITGEKDLDRGIDSLLNKGVKNIVVTLGKNGCIFVNKEERIKRSACRVKAIDTVAAGDTFLGFFVGSLATGKSIKESLRYASAGAGLSTTKKGAAPSIPTLDEVNTFLAK